MSQDQAEQWITVSAVTVAGVYAYRRFVEPAAPPATAKKLAGIGELPPLGSWATAWGFTFLVLAVIAEGAPSLGGSLAILIATGDLLTNTKSLTDDLAKQEKNKSSSSSSSASSSSASSASSDATVDPGFPPLSPVFPPSVTPSPHSTPTIDVPQVPILTGPMHGGTFN